MLHRDSNQYRYNKTIYLSKKPKLPLPTKVQQILAEDIMRVCNKVANSVGMNYADSQELSGELVYLLLEYGGNVLANLPDGKGIDDLIGLLGGYAKKISKYQVAIFQNQKNMLRRNSDDFDVISEDRDRTLVDKETNVEEEAIRHYDFFVDLDMDMIEILKSNPIYIRAVAEKMEISQEEVLKKIDQMIDRMQRPNSSDLEESFGETNLLEGLSAQPIISRKKKRGGE